MDKNIKILVVEDTDYQLGIYSFTLDHLGYKNVVLAKNGSEAFSLLEKDPVDLIISDCEMPEMDGLSLLRKVRTTPSHQDVPFIMITGLGDEETKKEAIKEGVTDF